MSLKISLAILLLLASTACKQVHQPPPQSKTGNMLQVELRMPEPWKQIVISPSQQKEYPKVPSRFSMFMTGESTGALKPYLLIEDSTGVQHSILLAMATGEYSEGKVLSIALIDAPETSHDTPGAFPLDSIKPPIKIKGLFLISRKPLQHTLVHIDNLSFDDVVVEDFESETGWRVIEKESAKSYCDLRISPGPIPGRGMEGLTIKESFPDREGSLTSNTSFEKDEDHDGVPDGWFPANLKEMLPLYQSGKPMVNLDDYKGKIAWENIGAESPRSVSVSVEKPGAWAAVGTMLKDVKPNTYYTVLCNHP